MGERMLRALGAQLEKDGLLLGVRCGAGSFCNVYKVYEKETGLLYGVAKVAPFSDDDSVSSATAVVADNKHAMLKETDILRHNAREPYIVSLKQDVRVFRAQGRQYGYFIMEPLASLTESEEIINGWIRTYGAKIVLAYLGYAVCSALAAVHAKNRAFSHRDVKTSNIFVRLTPNLCLSKTSFKLGDFGICSNSEKAATYSVNIRNRQDPFRSPDLIPSIESDVYSLACVMAYYGGMPFNGFSGSRSASDYGRIGRCIEQMLSADKQERPTLKTCMEVFGEVISKYEKKINEDEKVCSSAIQRLNAGKTDVFVLPQNAVQGQRLCGIRDWLRGDTKAARMNFSTAGDTISRFYIVSMDAQEGNFKAALDGALQLRQELDEKRNHPVFDNIVALLYSLGYPLNKLDQATASAVLSRADGTFTVM